MPIQIPVTPICSTYIGIRGIMTPMPIREVNTESANMGNIFSIDIGGRLVGEVDSPFT
jgi:hypothetical protein